MRAIVLFMLGWIIYPLWLLAGLGDLWCHRRTSIATTSGTVESLLHLAQLFVLGIAVLIALFLEITTAVFLIAIVLVAIHSALSFIDVAYTNSRRHISALEQHIHAYMEVLPWTSLALLAALHPQAFMEMNWAVQLKATPLPMLILLIVIVPSVLLAVIPACIELLTTERERRHPHPSGYTRIASA
jgi:hypothetical protein